MARKTIIVCDGCGRDLPVRKFKLQVIDGETVSRQLDLCEDCSAPVVALMGEPKRRSRFKVTSEEEFLRETGQAPAPRKRASKKATPPGTTRKRS